jgi:hypothetical protein
MDLDNFIIGKTKEMRGEGRVGKKKSNSCLTRATAGKHRSSRRGEEKSSRSSRTSPNKSAAACQKTAALVSLLAENR